MPRDPFAVLGLPPDATPAQLRDAFRTLARKYHPDHFRTYVERVWATRRMQDINDAYAAARRHVGSRAHASDSSLSSQSALDLHGQPTRGTPTSGGVGASDNGLLWYYFVWAIASVLLSARLAHTTDPRSTLDWVIVVVSGFFISPLLLVAAFAFVFFPLFLIGMVFRRSFSEHSIAGDTQWPVLLREALLRIAVFIALAWLATRLWLSEPSLVFSSFSVFFALAMAGLLGELAAMVLWLIRVKKVASRTQTLLLEESSH